MSKTRLFLGASLIALALGTVTQAQAGFDRPGGTTAGLGNSATAGAYHNPYLTSRGQGAQQSQANAQPQGYGLQPWSMGAFGLHVPGASGGIHTPFGGFGFNPLLGGFNLNMPGVSAHASSPFGGFGLPIFPIGPFHGASGYHPGGFSINLPGMSGGMTTPVGGFGIHGVPRWAPVVGGFGLHVPGASGGIHTPFGGFNLNLPGVSARGNSPFGGFNLNLPGGVSARGNSPFGGFSLFGPTPYGGFNLKAPGVSAQASSPMGGFGIHGVPSWSPFIGGFDLNLPGGVSAHGGSPFGGFSLFGPTPYGGFNLKAPGVSAHASSPMGGFGIHGVPSWAPVVGGFGLFQPHGFNLGRAPMQPEAGQTSYGYAPYGYRRPAAPAGGARQTQTVSCSINEVSLLTRSVSDCEKAGGTVVAANLRR